MITVDFFLCSPVTKGHAMGAVHQPQISNAHLNECGFVTRSVHQATLKKCHVAYFTKFEVGCLQNHPLSIPTSMYIIDHMHVCREHVCLTKSIDMY